MFDWLKRKEQLGASTMHFDKCTLPEPTRPAPPMPTIKPQKVDISEPVITLLKMLERDEWVCIYDGGCIVLINTRNSSLQVCLRFSRVGDYQVMLPWLNHAEQKAVKEVALRRQVQIRDAAKAELDKQQRAAFAKQLGVLL